MVLRRVRWTLVASAERHGIGFVSSLFWYWSTLPDVAGEHVGTGAGESIAIP